MEHKEVLDIQKTLQRNDLITVEGRNTKLFFWKLVSVKDKTVVLSNLGETVEMEIAEITKIDKIRQPTPCECGRWTELNNDGLCSICARKKMRIESPTPRQRMRDVSRKAVVISIGGVDL